MKAEFADGYPLVGGVNPVGLVAVPNSLLPPEEEPKLELAPLKKVPGPPNEPPEGLAGVAGVLGEPAPEEPAPEEPLPDPEPEEPDEPELDDPDEPDPDPDPDPDPEPDESDESDEPDEEEEEEGVPKEDEGVPKEELAPVELLPPPPSEAFCAHMQTTPASQPAIARAFHCRLRAILG